jgi:hypothetical protein
VAKIDINYAKTAKRVDVRRLKTAMWSLLCSQEQAEKQVGFDSVLSIFFFVTEGENFSPYF